MSEAEDRRRIAEADGVVRHRRFLVTLLAASFFCLIWLRCPTVITRAQFWAEDGWTWYPEAYDQGWRSLGMPHSAYLQTISRLVALLSQLAPLSWAPPIFALCALFVQGMPSVFLLSRRMESAIPSFAVRAGLGLLLVVLPDSQEVFVNLTNAQWFLSLLTFLVLSAAPARTAGQRVFDCAVLIVGGLSGPFVVFLLPVAVLWWIVERQSWRLWQLGIIAAAAMVQIALILSLQNQRDAGTLGASVHGFMEIILGEVVGPATFGIHRMLTFAVPGRAGFLETGGPAVMALCAAGVVLAVVLASLAFVRGRWVLRAFMIFAGVEFAASLADGIASPWWPIMEFAPGGRYFLHPIIAWLAIVATLAFDRAIVLRVMGTAFLAATVLLAIPSDWSVPAMPKTTFYRKATAFEQAAPGTVAQFDIRPVGTMTLVRR